ncbi:MAG: conserved rane protein of unknown function [Pseudonocardiales bacterium]|nr:conserved rane protein of unknown function [Pseudonocardiales bacterium]
MTLVVTEPSQAEGAAARAPGLAVAVVLAVVATVFGRVVPLIGAPVLGIVLGVALSRRLGTRARLRPGIAFASTTILQLAVVVLGSQLSLRQVVHVGAGSLPVMIGTLLACLALAYLVGRRLGIGRDLRTLIGVGTAICGASAIAAVSPVIRAKSSDVAYAISTIFLFNIAAVLSFPAVGHLLGLGQHAFGLFAGTAVNDTSSVVAAATSYGTQAGDYAVVVKLTRTLMIIPICLALAAVTRRRDGAPSQGAVRLVTRLIPWFLVGFLLVAAANTAGLVPAASHAGLRTTSVFLITVALSGIGLSTDLAGLRRAGPRPVLLGLVLWIAVAATSLMLQTLATA